MTNTATRSTAAAAAVSAVSFAEVLHASDFPGGVINLITGKRDELLEQFASHMDVNAIVYCGEDATATRKVQEAASQNIKRVFVRGEDWNSAGAQNPYLISDTQETKTTWHPIGS